jgi:hypothetical protein
MPGVRQPTSEGSSTISLDYARGERLRWPWGDIAGSCGAFLVAYFIAHVMLAYSFGISYVPRGTEPDQRHILRSALWYSASEVPVAGATVVMFLFLQLAGCWLFSVRAPARLWSLGIGWGLIGCGMDWGVGKAHWYRVVTDVTTAQAIAGVLIAVFAGVHIAWRRAHAI